MSNDTLSEALFAASGIAAYALATATLSLLQEKGLLSAQDVIAAIEDALAGLEKVHAAKPGVELHVARELLETSLAQLRGAPPAED
jgi:hypothetical protein